MKTLVTKYILEKDATRLPLVTVVTPSYNQGRFIEETIISVLTQDYPNVEYIIVDGGSTDSTLDIIRKYQDRLIWMSEADRGQSHAINKGFRLARGEILAWINSDDKYEQGAISASVKFLIEHPDIAMTYGKVNVISEDGLTVKRKPSPKPFDLWAITHWAYGIDQASTFFRKSALDNVGYIDERLNWSMDGDLWIRIGSRFNIGTIDAVMASIRMYYGTKTTTGGIRRIFENVSVMRRYSKCSLSFAVLRTSLGMFHMYLMYSHHKLYRFLKKVIIYLKNHILDRFYSNYQGVFSDGWLGRKARFMFPVHADAKNIQFTLKFPEDARLFPNRVTAKVDNREVVQLQILTHGTYELRLPISMVNAKAAEVVLAFSRALPPDDQRRRLACKLENISFER